MNQPLLDAPHLASRSPMTLFRRNTYCLVFWLLALAASLIAYAQVLHAPFVSDDNVYLTENHRLLNLPLTELWKLFVEPFNIYEFLPLRDLSYWIDVALFGLDPASLRIHNFVLYAIACFLVFVTTAKLCVRLRADTAHAAAWTAAVTTALFAVHPAHLEAVVWISGRKDLMSAIFSLSALWMALEIDARTRRSALLIAGIAIAIVGALLSKATAIVVAPLLTLLAFHYFRHNATHIPRPTLLALAVAPLAVAALSFAVFYQASRVVTAQYYGAESIERFFAILGWLARLSLSFEDRKFFYPVLDTPAMPYMVLAGAAVLAAALIGVAFAVWRNSLRGFCAFAFFIFCLPYTQLLPFSTFSLVSDRFLFLAVWPVCLLLATASKKMAYHLALAALGIAWLAETIDRPGAWASAEELIRRDTVSWPGHELPLTNKVGLLLAAARVDEARQAAQSIQRQDVRQFITALVDSSATVKRSLRQPGSLPMAIGELSEVGEAVAAPPADAHWNMPVLYIYRALGADIATDLWTLLAQAYPDHADVQHSAGVWFFRVGRFAQSEQSLRKAVNLFGADADIAGTAAKQWGLAQLNLGDKAGAERAFRLALQVPHPDIRAACLLTTLLSDSRRHQEAAPFRMMCDSGKIKTDAALSQ